MTQGVNLKIGLCVIAKDKADIIVRMLDSTQAVFDKYYLQDTGSTDDTVGVFEKWCKDNDREFRTSKKYVGKDYAVVYPFPDKPTLAEFNTARNDSFDMAKEDGLDYVMWLDTDDVLHNAHMLREIVGAMHKQNIPTVLMRYDYAERVDNVSSQTQLRERIINIKVPGKWHDRVHEAYLVDGYQQMPPTVEEMFVTHKRSIDQFNETGRRNMLIMTKQLEDDGIEQFSSRMLSLLAYDHYEYKEWDKAIEYYTALIDREKPREVGNSMYWTYYYVAKCYEGKGLFGDAIKYCFEAIKSDPNQPLAYLLIAQLFIQINNNEQAYKYAEKVIEIGVPKTPMAINETELVILPRLIKLQALVNSGRLDEALRMCDELIGMFPNNQQFKVQKRDVEKMYETNKAVEGLNDIVKYAQKTNNRKYLNTLKKAIPPDLRENQTVRKLIQEMKYDYNREKTKVKLQGSKTIVIYAGGHYEPWDGRSDKERGIGGSEGMCIQMARELASLGNKIMVFNEPGESDGKEIDGVFYQHHSKWNKDMKCDVFLSLRRPDIFSNFIAATKQYPWLHDTGYGDVPLINFLTPNKVLCLSEAHKDVLKLSHNIEFDSVFHLTRNSINKYAMRYADKHAASRNPYQFIYASSYDRGLDHVLAMWPKIKEAIPEATLKIFYGWNTYDAMMMQRQGTPQGQSMAAYKSKIVDLIAKLDGVQELGRVSQNELYKHFAESSVWLYPTEFYEISCINAMTAQAMGAIPLCTPYAALNETVDSRFGFKYPLDKIADAAIYLMQNQGELDKRRGGMKKWARSQYDVKKLAKEWDEFFNND